MADAARFSASNHKAPIRFMGQGGPDFLPVDHPTAGRFVQRRAGLDVGQVGAGPWLGIALAPEARAVDDPRQKTLLLLDRAECGDSRPGQAFADMPHAPWAASAGVLFVKNHLPRDRQPTPAMLRRPADACPAALGQFALPGFALLGKHVLIARAAAKTQGLEFATEVGAHPVGDFLAKALVLLAETDFHGCSPRITAAIRSRCQAGSPRKLSLARARLK